MGRCDPNTRWRHVTLVCVRVVLCDRGHTPPRRDRLAARAVPNSTCLTEAAVMLAVCGVRHSAAVTAARVGARGRRHVCTCTRSRLLAAANAGDLTTERPRAMAAHGPVNDTCATSSATSSAHPVRVCRKSKLNSCHRRENSAQCPAALSLIVAVVDTAPFTSCALPPSASNGVQFGLGGGHQPTRRLSPRRRRTRPCWCTRLR